MYLAQADVYKRLGETYQLEPAMVGAVVLTESSGQDLVKVGDKMLPVIRWEGHYFDKYVPAHLQAEARKLKLASPKAGAIKNPKDQGARYAILHRAMQLDAAAALMSISIGIGQVMGAHYVRLGFESPQHLFDYNCQGFEAQADCMMRYNVAFDLVDELQRHDFKGFARGYNGKNYAAGGYDRKLKENYELLSGRSAPVSSSAGMLSMGSTGTRVRELQQLLVRAGYTLNVDADYGPATRDVVKVFQKASGLKPDGVAGPETMKALAALRQEGDKLGIGDTKGVIDGLVIAVGGPSGLAVAQSKIEEAAGKVSGLGKSWMIDLVSNSLWTAAAVAMLAGLALSGYTWWRAHR